VKSLTAPRRAFWARSALIFEMHMRRS